MLSIEIRYYTAHRHHLRFCKTQMMTVERIIRASRERVEGPVAYASGSEATAMRSESSRQI